MRVLAIAACVLSALAGWSGPAWSCACCAVRDTSYVGVREVPVFWGDTPYAFQLGEFPFGTYTLTGIAEVAPTDLDLRADVLRIAQADHLLPPRQFHATIDGWAAGAPALVFHLRDPGDMPGEADGLDVMIRVPVPAEVSLAIPPEADYLGPERDESDKAEPDPARDALFPTGFAESLKFYPIHLGAETGGLTPDTVLRIARFETTAAYEVVTPETRTWRDVVFDPARTAAELELQGLAGACDARWSHWRLTLRDPSGAVGPISYFGEIR